MQPTEHLTLPFPIFAGAAALPAMRISSLEDWFRLAPPADPATQWQVNFSAMETARRWVGGLVPAEIRHLLHSADSLDGFVAQVAFAEVVTRLDTFSGNSRNHDLLVHGAINGKPALLDIEGKGHEPHGRLVREVLASVSQKPQSRIPDRVRRLRLALLGAEQAKDLDLRYQLFHGVAAALIRGAEIGATTVAHVFHIFESVETKPSAAARNAEDLDSFVTTLSHGAVTCVQPGQLVGPFHVPGLEESGQPTIPSGLDLFIGKAVVTLP